MPKATRSNYLRTSRILNETVNANEMSRGSMPMLRVLPSILRDCLVSASTSSFEASRKIRRTVDIAPNMAPADNVATVTVVVTVEIISSPFSAVLYQSMYYHPHIRFIAGATMKRTTLVIPCESETPIIFPFLRVINP